MEYKNDRGDADFVSRKNSLGLGLRPWTLWKAFTEAGSVRLSRYDDSEHIENVKEGFEHFMDLATPQWIGNRLNWVSLEGGEHIVKEAEVVFIDNIVRHAT